MKSTRTSAHDVLGQERPRFDELRASIALFMAWEDKHMHGAERDELVVALHERYSAQADEERLELLAILFRVCRAFGARMVSVSQSDLIIFEDLKGDGGWPATWAIAEKMGIAFGCGNSGQHQIRFKEVGGRGGTYDIRDAKAVFIAASVGLNEFRMNSPKWNTSKITSYEYLQSALWVSDPTKRGS